MLEGGHACASKATGFTWLPVADGWTLGITDGYRMPAATLPILVNVFVAGMFVASFLTIAQLNPGFGHIRWFAASYAVGMLTPLAEFLLPIAPSPVPFMIMSYAGVFRLQNIPEEHIHPVLVIDCARLLFPFARQIIAEAVQNGGFPAFYVPPIDFAALYQQRMEEMGQGGATNS